MGTCVDFKDYYDVLFTQNISRRAKHLRIIHSDDEDEKPTEFTNDNLDSTLELPHKRNHQFHDSIKITEALEKCQTNDYSATRLLCTRPHPIYHNLHDLSNHVSGLPFSKYFCVQRSKVCDGWGLFAKQDITDCTIPLYPYYFFRSSRS